MKVSAKLTKGSVIKLLTIIGNNDLRQAEPAHDRLLNEVMHNFFDDLGKWFYFNPFGEVVDHHDDFFFRGLVGVDQECPSPLNKSPRRANGSE